MLTIAKFNEAHQCAFGCAPEFGAPERDGPDHCPVVSVSLDIEGVPLVIGKGSNQKLARQDAVNQVVGMFANLPHELRRAIEAKLEAF